MPALFVTATGTDVGKTFVCAGLLRAGLRAGRAMDALKPVMSGYTSAATAESDAGALLAALGRPATAAAIAALAPWRFAAPLSPDMAAAMEDRTIPFDDLIVTCLTAAMRPDVTTLIEGVGGVMVPLDERHTVLDLAVVLALPVLLVSGTALGAISHALTAVAAMACRGLAPQALLLNESAGSTVETTRTRDSIANFCPGLPILILPRAADDAAFDRLLDLLPGLASSRHARSAQ